MPRPSDLTRERELALAADAVRVEDRLALLGRDQAVAHRRVLEALLELQRIEVDLGRGMFTPVGASMVLCVTEHRAQALLAEAHRLAELDRGFELYDVLTAEQVAALLDAVEDLEPEVADRVVDVVREKVIATGAGLGRRWISDTARRARQRIAPKLEDKRRRRAAAGRKVTAHPRPDGQAALWIEGPQAAITAMQVAIRDRVSADGGDWFQWEDRTLDARRFDAVTALITGNRSCTCSTRPTLWTEATPTAPGAAPAVRPCDATDIADGTGPCNAPATPSSAGVGAIGAGSGSTAGRGYGSGGTDASATGAGTPAGSIQCGGRAAQPGTGCCSGHGARPESADLPVITILIPLATALGLSDEPATRLPSQRALPGGSALAGPMGAIEARELLRTDVLIRALAVDPITGQPVGQPSPAVRPHQPDPPPQPPRGTASKRRRASSRRAPLTAPARPPLDDGELRSVLDRLQCWVATSPLTRAAPEVPGYVVPAGMAREVRARAGTCEWSGCLVPAERCDLDHDIPWPLGPTVGWNLGPLCRRHHRTKQEGWTKTRHPDGSLTWTSPTSRTFHRPSWHPTPTTSDVTAGDTSMDVVTPAPVAAPGVGEDAWDTTPEGLAAFDPLIDDPWSGTPAIDPAQLVDPLTIPTPDDHEPDGDRYSHGRADLPLDNCWAWIDDPTHDLPHPAELALEPPANWTPTA